MADLGSYDEGAKPLDSFEPLPAGPYLAMIVDSDVKPTSKNNGDILTLKWIVLEGEHAGRFLFDRVNIRHTTPKAQEIGQRQLASIRAATGVNAPRTSEELHNIPCWLDVKVRPAGPGKDGQHYEASNEIKRYASGSEPIATGGAPGGPAVPTSAPAPTAPVAQAARPAAAPAGNVPPWQRK